MENIENKKKNNDVKGISLISIGILTIVVAIAGATFAFFQVSISNNTAITGTSAYTASPFTLNVTHSTSGTAGTKALIPQSDEYIQSAVTAGCVDANSNAICKVYTITIQNKTTTKYYVNGTLTFATTPATTSTAGMPNLKWAMGTSATAGFPSTTSGPFYSTFNTFTTNTSATTQTTTIVNNLALTANATQTYYVVVWISETGAAQSDNGTFTGTVTFNGFSDSGNTISGVTSTIRS